MQMTTDALLNTTLLERNASTIARLGILRIDAIEYNKQYELVEGVPDYPIALYECQLAWCKKHYGPANVTNGILNEPISSQPKPLRGPLVYDSSNEDCTDPTPASKLAYKTYHVFHEPTQPGPDADVDDFDAEHSKYKDTFLSCPNITGLSEKHRLYVANSNDEWNIE